MELYTRTWSMKEYEELEPQRLTATTLEMNQFYFLGLPNRGGTPEAFRALVQLENLRHELGQLCFKVHYYTKDLTPSKVGPQTSSLQNSYWIPKGSLKLNFTNGAHAHINQGYFLPYEDQMDDELRKVFESFSLLV